MNSQFLQVYIEPVIRGYRWFLRYSQARLESIMPLNPLSSHNPDGPDNGGGGGNGGGGDDDEEEYTWVCVAPENEQLSCEFLQTDAGYATQQECVDNCWQPPEGYYVCTNPDAGWGSRCIFVENAPEGYTTWVECENRCGQPGEPGGCYIKATKCPVSSQCNIGDDTPDEVWLLCASVNPGEVFRAFGVCYEATSETKENLDFGDQLVGTPFRVYETCDGCCNDCCDCEDCCFDRETTLKYTINRNGYTNRCNGVERTCEASFEQSEYALVDCQTQTTTAVFERFTGTFGPESLLYDCINDEWINGDTLMPLECPCDSGCTLPPCIGDQACSCPECTSDTSDSTCYSETKTVTYHEPNDLADCTQGCLEATNQCDIEVTVPNCQPYVDQDTGEIECASNA